jgi:hypothetical protein
MMVPLMQPGSGTCSASRQQPGPNANEAGWGSCLELSS